MGVSASIAVMPVNNGVFTGALSMIVGALDSIGLSSVYLITPLPSPELLEFPFLWQQTEYVLGGGSSHYMFLVLAAQDLSKKQ